MEIQTQTHSHTQAEAYIQRNKHTDIHMSVYLSIDLSGECELRHS